MVAGCVGTEGPEKNHEVTVHVYISMYIYIYTNIFRFFSTPSFPAN